MTTIASLLADGLRILADRRQASAESERAIELARQADWDALRKAVVAECGELGEKLPAEPLGDFPCEAPAHQGYTVELMPFTYAAVLVHLVKREDGWRLLDDCRQSPFVFAANGEERATETLAEAVALCHECEEKAPEQIPF